MAGVSGLELGRRLGTSQSTVSRYESGRLVPSMLEAGRIGWALRATPADRRELIERARRVADERAGIVPRRVLMQHGVASLQRRIRLRERSAEHVATFQPSMVPGLLQTEAYMRAVVSGPPETSDAESEAWVRERLTRQLQRRQPGRSAVQLVAEAALHWGVAGSSVMAEQCRHVARLALARDGWHVGIIPRMPADGGAPLFVTNGFTILDSTSVQIGTTVGNALVTDQQVVQEHVALFARLEALAVFGEEAAAIAGHLAALYDSDR